jgi:hypothetical protein
MKGMRIFGAVMACRAPLTDFPKGSVKRDLRELPFDQGGGRPGFGAIEEEPHA